MIQSWYHVVYMEIYSLLLSCVIGTSSSSPLLLLSSNAAISEKNASGFLEGSIDTFRVGTRLVDRGLLNLIDRADRPSEAAASAAAASIDAAA